MKVSGWVLSSCCDCWELSHPSLAPPPAAFQMFFSSTGPELVCQPVPCSPSSPPLPILPPPHMMSPSWQCTCSSYPIPIPQKSEGHTEVTSTALFLLKVFIFLSFSPYPFFYIFFPLASLHPLLCASALQAEGQPDKKLLVLSDPFTKPPSRLLLPPHSPARFTGSPGRKCQH